jgi:hypothetical protein
VTGELHEIDPLELGWARRPSGDWTRCLGTLGRAVVIAELRRSARGWAVTVSVVGEDRSRRLYNTPPGQERATLTRGKRVAVGAYRQAEHAYEAASRLGSAV